MTDINYRFIIDVSESVPAELDETLTEGACERLQEALQNALTDFVQELSDSGIEAETSIELES